MEKVWRGGECENKNLKVYNEDLFRVEKALKVPRHSIISSTCFPRFHQDSVHIFLLVDPRDLSTRRFHVFVLSCLRWDCVRCSSLTIVLREHSKRKYFSNKTTNSCFLAIPLSRIHLTKLEF